MPVELEQSERAVTIVSRLRQGNLPQRYQLPGREYIAAVDDSKMHCLVCNESIEETKPIFKGVVEHCGSEKHRASSESSPVSAEHMVHLFHTVDTGLKGTEFLRAVGSSGCTIKCDLCKKNTIPKGSIEQHLRTPEHVQNVAINRVSGSIPVQAGMSLDAVCAAIGFRMVTCRQGGGELEVRAKLFGKKMTVRRQRLCR